MSAQREQPSIPADHRSVHPHIAGVPWWGAVLIAVVASATGFAIDVGSGGKELSAAFSTLYVLGCLAAVLVVRQAAVFTSVIQPPLILFIMVPGAYYLMHSSDIHGIKDLLINCGYPLIERFPLMFFTSATVLLLGVARWYLGASSRNSESDSDEARATGGWLSTTLASLLGKESASAPSDQEPRRHSVDRRRRDAPRAATDRADRNRPRPRRPRPGEPAPPEGARRRARSSRERDPRRAVPPNERRKASDRSERRERPQPRRRRDDHRPDDYRPNDYRPDDYRPNDYQRPDDYQPLDPQGPTSHHPVSQVRYRGAEDPEDRREYRPRRRDPRDAEPERWKYDN